MGFDAQDKKISKILKTDYQYIIPRYQRKYVWTEKNWKDLYEDIMFIYLAIDENDSINHFFGSFVFQEDEDNKKLKIIDGQQRTITIFIMLACLANVFKKMENEGNHKGLKQYLFSRYDNGNEYLILNCDEIILGDILNNSIEYTDEILENKISSIKPNNENEKNILDCVKFFLFKFDNIIYEKENALQKAEKLRDIILGLNVVEIIVNNEEEGYSVFESLNARGIDLEDHELLKNYIFRYYIPQREVDKAKADWNNLLQTLTFKQTSEIVKFLEVYSTHKYTKPSKKGLSTYQIIKENSDKKNVKILVDDLLLKAQYYRFINIPNEYEDDEIKEILSFFISRRHQQFRPLFLSLFSKHKENVLTKRELINTLKFLQNFFFIFTVICQNRPNKTEKIVYNFSKRIENEYSKDLIQEMKNKFLELFPNFDTFQNYFINIGYSKKNKNFYSNNQKREIRYILTKIEDHLQSDELRVNNFSIEHIKPDSVSEDICAKIGNLLPLKEKINNQANILSLPQKIEIYKKSDLRMVNNFIERYENKKEWTNDLIESRGKYLAKIAYNEIWKLK